MYVIIIIITTRQVKVTLHRNTALQVLKELHQDKNTERILPFLQHYVCSPATEQSHCKA